LLFPAVKVQSAVLKKLQKIHNRYAIGDFAAEAFPALLAKQFEKTNAYPKIKKCVGQTLASDLSPKGSPWPQLCF
jgi:hypothetical protein